MRNFISIVRNIERNFQCTTISSLMQKKEAFQDFKSRSSKNRHGLRECFCRQTDMLLSFSFSFLFFLLLFIVVTKDEYIAIYAVEKFELHPQSTNNILIRVRQLCYSVFFHLKILLFILICISIDSW